MRSAFAMSLTCWILLLSAACFAEREATRNQAIALSARGFEVSDLRYGNTPFRLYARFRLLDTAPKPVEGTYDLQWKSNEAWSEQITLPGYTETRVQHGDRVSVQRPGLVVPSRLEAVRRLLSVGGTLAITPNDRITKIKNMQFDGTRARCFVRQVGSGNEQTVCFNDSTGAFLGTETSWGTRRTYSQFRTEGTRLIPYRIVFYEQRKQTIEVNVDKISVPKDITPASISGPAEEFGSCVDESHPLFLSGDYPQLPEGVAGSVNTWVTLDATGHVSGVAVEDAVRDDYRETIASGLKKWRYVPAKCGQVAVPSEFGVMLRFDRPGFSLMLPRLP